MIVPGRAFCFARGKDDIEGDDLGPGFGEAVEQLGDLGSGPRPSRGPGRGSIINHHNGQTFGSGEGSPDSEAKVVELALGKLKETQGRGKKEDDNQGNAQPKNAVQSPFLLRRAGPSQSHKGPSINIVNDASL
jgi:hypothetical protein